jgi:hypothetical protein
LLFFVGFTNVGQQYSEYKMQQHKHHELLRGNFKSFGHFADRLLAAKDNFEFFRIIVEEIVPLLQQGQAFKQFSLLWEQKKANHRKQYSHCQKKAIKQISKALAALKFILNQECLLENAALSKDIAVLEVLLARNEKFSIASQEIERAEGQFQQLCYQLLNLERADLVKSYAEVVYIKQYKTDPQTREMLRNPQTGMPVEYEKSGILQFTFAPAIYELAKLDTIFRWDMVNEAWVAWEYFGRAAWCWNESDVFFQNKEIDLNNSYSQSIYLMNLKSLWNEMNIIKQHRTIDPSIRDVCFFTRERFLKYFNLIIDTVILDQEISAPENLALSNEPASPYSIEMRLFDDHLLLNVQWEEGNAIKAYIIHKLLVESDPHKFIEHVTELEAETMILLKDIGINSGSIPKLFERTKLRGILAHIFFKKPSKRKSGGIIFRGKYIITAKIEGLNLVELRQKIKELKEYSELY